MVGKVAPFIVARVGIVWGWRFISLCSGEWVGMWLVVAVEIQRMSILYHLKRKCQEVGEGGPPHHDGGPVVFQPCRAAARQHDGLPQAAPRLSQNITLQSAPSSTPSATSALRIESIERFSLLSERFRSCAKRLPAGFVVSICMHQKHSVRSGCSCGQPVTSWALTSVGTCW